MILHKGETLFRQGETGPLYGLRSGILKIVRLHPVGSQVLVNLIVPGEIIPHHSLISPNAYFRTAVALAASEVETLPNDVALRDFVRYAERPITCPSSVLNFGLAIHFRLYANKYVRDDRVRLRPCLQNLITPLLRRR